MPLIQDQDDVIAVLLGLLLFALGYGAAWTIAWALAGG